MKTKFRMLSAVAVVAGIVLTMSTADAQSSKKEAAKKDDAPSIVGTWKVSSGMRAGAEIEGDRLPPEIKVTDKTFTIPAGPDQSFVMAYEIDADVSPVAVDMEIEEGPAEGTALGIVKVKDGTVTLCYDPTGQNRPKEFKSTEENGFFLFVMNKAKKEFDASKMVGEWQCVAGVRAGEEIGDDRLPPSISVSDKAFTIPVGPDQSFVMGYEVNVEKSPAAVDMKIEEGPAEGTALGIVKMEDGKLFLCYDPTGQNRPKEFKSTEENGFFLFEMEAIVD